LGSVTRVNAALHVFNKDGVLACGKTRDPSRGKQHIGCADSAGHAHWVDCHRCQPESGNREPVFGSCPELSGAVVGCS
jgi:hypothetical protein